jgi:ABC-type antimicrobial peptide transport system permease subunit
MLSYLANSIGVVGPDATGDSSSAQAGIPYSTVTALDVRADDSSAALTLTDGSPATALGRRDILLNEWAAEDLGVKLGDSIALRYYVRRPFGQLGTEETIFVLRGIVRMQGWAADPGMTPDYEGITDATNLTDWRTPFPIDMRRIREKDERYWDDYRTTPKAFISLSAGQQLWAASDARFGRLTAVRLFCPAGRDLQEASAAFREALLERLPPEELGLTFQPVRQRALAASRGSTDFGMLFSGFSLFLILSAAMMVALLFRLGVERRAKEIGTLLATGFSARRVACMFLVEGTVLAGAGTIVGLGGAVGYAWLMLAGLRSWWAKAVNTPILELHTTPLTFAIGFAASLLVALLSIAWACRGLHKLTPRALLAGTLASGRCPAAAPGRRNALILTAAALAVTAAMVALSLLTDAVPQTAAFFGGGTATLVAFAGGLWLWTARGQHKLIHQPGVAALARLGVRNATRNRSRSMLIVALIASAAFVIVAVGANRRGVATQDFARSSPTGGFALMAEAVVPLQHDLNTPQGHEALSLADTTSDLLKSGTVVPFRLLLGGDASCLNLYRVRQPRILGASELMLSWAGFSFAASLAQTPDEKANPWTLLQRRFDDGAVPAIGDYNAVKWLLHLGLGQDLVVQDEHGRNVPLRIVGTLAGSVLQGELVIAEGRFTEMFPSVSGYGFFLIDSPPSQARNLERALEADLSSFGFDVASTTDRLAEYLSVENTYLSTFQMLGGLGLLLGTLGLGAVMLRNVLQRRGELALLRALGFRRSTLGWMVLAENSVLLGMGLVAGGISAMLAVAPHAASSPGEIPWLSLGGTLLAVFLAGTLAGAAALVPTLRAPLLPALRTE